MKKIPVWPTLATVGNLLCGFSALAAAVGGDFQRSAWLILAAMLFDAADGRLARLTRSATEFGGQLDSMADLLSFGVAPAFLVHNYVLVNIPGYLDKLTWTASAVFVICASLRLARFNAENSTESSAHRTFKGLPTPAAGGLVASAVIFLEDLTFYLPKILGGLVPIAAIVVAVLMVTRIRYPHLVSQLDIGGRPFSFLVLLIFLGMLVALVPQLGLFILFALYAASGPIGLTMDQVIERLAASDGEDGLF